MNTNKYDKVYVLDTNIILTDASQLIAIGDSGKNLIVLPETVIDELDAKKSGFGEINYQSREFGRLLSEAVFLRNESRENGNVSVMSILAHGIFIDIISFKDYDISNTDSSVLNDRKIIKAAVFAKNYYKNYGEFCFLSNDVMCRTRALSLGVPSRPLDKNKRIGNPDYIKEIMIGDSSEFVIMEGEDIKNYDPDYIPENYSYRVKATDGSERIAYIVNGKINLIPDSLFNGLIVKPLNLGQRFAVAGMLDERVELVIINSLAGSGKTLLALSAGISLVSKGVYDKIVYIRNSVESVDKAEEVGFLSGNEEKFKIYNYPLYDNLEFISKREIKKKKDAPTLSVNEIMEKYSIETMWSGSIRGRTVQNAFVIIDECQNISKASTQLILTRMDKDCKVVCVGSNRQIDHPYINKYTNGLSTLINASREENPEITIFATELNKVVRGKITEFAERIFENK